jgi:hypothetical protein
MSHIAPSELRNCLKLCGDGRARAQASDGGLGGSKSIVFLTDVQSSCHMLDEGRRRQEYEPDLSLTRIVQNRIQTFDVDMHAEAGPFDLVRPPQN